jgi:hypothetical protein
MILNNKLKSKEWSFSKLSTLTALEITINRFGALWILIPVIQLVTIRRQTNILIHTFSFYVMIFICTLIFTFSS